MDYSRFYKIAKIAMIIPIIAGSIRIVEFAMPLQKVKTSIVYKHISKSTRSIGTTYSIDFDSDFYNFTDQFTEEIYNTFMEGDTVNLEVMYFTKGVKTIQHIHQNKVMENDTSEKYANFILAAGFLGFGIYFIRKKYFTNRNYKIILILTIVSLMSFIRVITLNI